MNPRKSTNASFVPMIHTSSTPSNLAKIEAHAATLARALSRPGTGILRYGLVIVLLWIGGMKFTAYEAAGIAPLAVHSPFMHWLYLFLGERNFSNLLGIVEIALGLGIALRQLVPLVSGFASLFCAGMFLTTLTFLFTTPGWESTLGGFPALSAPVGQFLLKDIVAKANIPRGAVFHIMLPIWRGNKVMTKIDPTTKFLSFHLAESLSIQSRVDGF